MLAALERAGVHAAFFVCGEQVERRPEVVREIVAAGHALGLHGYRHQTRRQWTRKLLSDDIHRAIDVVAAATGTAPHLYRPPHGVFSLPGLRLDPRTRPRAAALVEVGARLGGAGDAGFDRPPRDARDCRR